LIHSPDQDVPHEETLDAMNELLDEEVIRHLGVSNFSLEETREAMALSEAPIFTNQVEYNVHERQDDLLSLCIDEEIMLTAYSPLGKGDRRLSRADGRAGRSPMIVTATDGLGDPDVLEPRSRSRELRRVRLRALNEEMGDLFAIDGDLDDDLASRLDL